MKANNQNKRRDAFKLGLIENTPLEGQISLFERKVVYLAAGRAKLNYPNVTYNDYKEKRDLV